MTAPSPSFFDPLHPSVGQERRSTLTTLSGGPLFLSCGICLLIALAGGVLPSEQFGMQRSVLSWLGVIGTTFFGVVACWSVFSRTRRRRAGYVSGRPDRVRQAIAEDVQLTPSPTRFRAMALAGVGDFGATRRALLSPGDGPKDEDRELELCARIVVEAFDGRREDALSLCRELVEVPLRSASGSQERRQARRAGVVAMARAVSGVGDDIDLAVLLRTPTFEPALYWACRYGAALYCCVHEDVQLALSLLKGAPGWPAQSFFKTLHRRISSQTCSVISSDTQVA